MPVAFINRRSIVGSENIIASTVSPSNSTIKSIEDNEAWEVLNKIFLHFVLTRGYIHKLLRFFNYNINHMVLSAENVTFTVCTYLQASFIMYGFFTLLQVYKFFLLIRFGRSWSPCGLSQALAFFDERLSKQDYISGDSCSDIDICMFSLVQMMTCGMSDETLPILFSFPDLLTWILRMNVKLEGLKELSSTKGNQGVFKKDNMCAEDKSLLFIKSRDRNIKQQLSQISPSNRSMVLYTYVYLLLLAPFYPLIFISVIIIATVFRCDIGDFLPIPKQDPQEISKK